MPKTQIDFDDRSAGFIAEQVQAGHFDSEDDVVKTAVKLFEKNANTYHQKRAEWVDMIDKGVAAADRGDMVEGEPFMRDMIDRMKAQK